MVKGTFSMLSAIHLLSALAAAQLFECDDCCKSDQNLAFINFYTNVTSDFRDELSWSIVSSTTNEPQDDSMKQYHRTFYLSSSSDLNLTAPANFSGCAVYFYGATPALQVPEGFDDYSDFSCDTVMSATCRTDILRQAIDNATVFLEQQRTAASESDFSICGALATSFTLAGIPESCAFDAQIPDWGLLLAGDFSDTEYGDVARSSNDLDCQVQNATDYTTFLARDSYLSAVPGSEKAKAIQNGTTPILTIFHGSLRADSNSSSFDPSEVQLSCLKTRPSERQQTNINRGDRTVKVVSAKVAMFNVLSIALLTML